MAHHKKELSSVMVCQPLSMGEFLLEKVQSSQVLQDKHPTNNKHTWHREGASHGAKWFYVTLCVF